MGLAAYEQTSPGVYEAFSVNGTQTSPVTTIHDGKRGTVDVKQFFVRADDAHTYSNITVKAQSKTADDDIGIGSNPGSTGWGVKLLAQDSQPTSAQWDAVDYGNTVSLNDITNSTTYTSVWVRIESPAGIRVQAKESIALYIQYTDTP